jgi:Leucine-rich repeat (LRR) protein
MKNPEYSPIKTLPTEVFSENVAKYLSPQDIGHFAKASQHTRALAKPAVRKLDLSKVTSIDAINAALKQYAGPQLAELNLDATLTWALISDDDKTKLNFNLLAKCTGLKKLNLNNWDLDRLPEALGKLTHLTDLSLANNELSETVSWRVLPRSLVKLNLNMNGLVRLPDRLKWLNRLEVLELNGNDFGRGNLSEIGQLSQLKSLSIASSGLEYMPEWIVKLQNLEYLHLNLDPCLHTNYALLNELPNFKVWSL